MLWYNDGPVPTTYPGPTRSPGAGSCDGFKVDEQFLLRLMRCRGLVLLVIELRRRLLR